MPRPRVALRSWLLVGGASVAAVVATVPVLAETSILAQPLLPEPWAFSPVEEDAAQPGAGEGGRALRLPFGIGYAAGRTERPDKAYLFVDGDWGRIEIGQPNGTAERLMITGNDVGIGRGAPLGRIADRLRAPGNLDTGVEKPATGDDAPVITVFTPRWMGLQLGASFGAGATAPIEAGIERGEANPNGYTVSLGYDRTWSGLGVNLSGVYQATSVQAAENSLGAWGLGGKLSYRGIELGAAFAGQDRPTGSQALVATALDAQQWWDVGLGFSAGQWQVSAGFLQGWSRDQGATSSQIDVLSIAGGYTPAAGWDLRADLQFVEVVTPNRGADTSATSAVVVISSILKF